MTFYIRFVPFPTIAYGVPRQDTCVALSAVGDMVCAIQLRIQEQSRELVAVEEFAKQGRSWWACPAGTVLQKTWIYP